MSGIWYQCHGSGQPICRFCQRASPAPHDGAPVERHSAPSGASRNTCPEFYLFDAALPGRYRFRPPWLYRLTSWWP